MWVLAIDVGKINLGFCLFDGKNIKFDIFNTEEFLTRKLIKTYKSVVFARAKILSDFMDKLFKKFEISHVYIEKQVQKNIVAKSIESCLGTLAISHGAIVGIYDPKNKFRYLNPKYDSKKKEHKKIVQNYSRTILKTYGYKTDYFDSFPKKDDISDAMCMAVFSWYENHDLSDNVVELLLDKYNIKLLNNNY